MKNEVWNLLGREVNIGEKIQFIAHLYEEDYDIPVTLINGVNKGKTIVVSAGVHSGEYPGMAACSILSEQIDPLKVNGRIIILHCINTQGFYTKHERFVPEDGGNMNDVFPGDKNGTLSKRLAAFLEENIIDEADFIVDLHSGQGEQLLSTCIFFPSTASEEVNNASLEVAKITTINNLIASAISLSFLFCTAVASFIAFSLNVSLFILIFSLLSNDIVPFITPISQFIASIIALRNSSVSSIRSPDNSFIIMFIFFNKR